MYTNSRPYPRGTILKDRAKDTLIGAWPLMTLAVLFMSLAGFAIKLLMYIPAYSLGEFANNLPPLGQIITKLSTEYIFTILLQAVRDVMLIGLCFMCLKVIFKSYTTTGDIFYGFRDGNFRSLFALTLAQNVVYYLCMAPCNYFKLGFTFSLFLPMDLERLLCILVSALIGYIIYFPICLVFDLAMFVKLDFPEKTFREVIRDSRLLLKGNLKEFFGLQCSFIPLELLAVLTLGLGFLWLIPYVRMTYALYYLELVQARQKSEPNLQ